MVRHSSALAHWIESKHPRGAQGRFVDAGYEGKTGARPRTSSIIHASGNRVDVAWEGLGRPTRVARLKAAAIRSHNRKIASKVVNKDVTVSPLDAAMRKARRALGTQGRKADSTSWAIPEHSRNHWVTVHWSKVSSKGRR